MEAFVITLREGVEAALVIALVLTYLNRTGREKLKSWVYAGIVLALVASILGAFGFSRIGLDPESEVLEGALYAAAAVLVVSLVIWMWRASKGMKQHIEERMDAITTSEGSRYGWGVLAFVFFMVLREGIETVLFLAALSLAGTPDIVGIVGGMAGLLLALLFGILFVRGSLRINLRLFFAVTSVVLLVLAIRLAAGALHEFHEAQLIGLPHIVEESIEFLTNEVTSTILLIALVVIPALMMLPKKWLQPVTNRMAR